MLAQAHRLRQSAEFSLVVRQGGKARSGCLVVHAAARSQGPVKVGFAVNRAVGDAVARNRVRRRLRHLVADRIPVLPAHASLVVRALPESADSDSRQLGRDLDGALVKLASRPLPTPAGAPG